MNEHLLKTSGADVYPVERKKKEKEKEKPYKGMVSPSPRLVRPRVNSAQFGFRFLRCE